MTARTGYDHIAHLYDIDMARNMPFDDIGLYTQICEREGGRALEAGCGNGRILLELISGGVDAVGVDCSARMLEALIDKAHRSGVPTPVCRMDARRLGFAGASFQVVLCPYSLVTYMVAAGEVDAMLGEIVRVLRPGGAAVLDAFIPRPVAGTPDFVLDYRRPYRDTTLVRSKRIASLAPGVNRIERRYEIMSAAGTLVERIDTREDIREFSVGELAARLTACELAVEQLWWNYGCAGAAHEAQFVTLLARKAA